RRQRRRPPQPGARLPAHAARHSRAARGERQVAVAASIAVDPMRMADIGAVHEIERLSFSTPWPAYAFEQELTANRLARYVVARAGSAVVGFGGVWLMVDEAHVTTIGVHPDWRRRGIGGRLLVALGDLCEERRAPRPSA